MPRAERLRRPRWPAGSSRCWTGRSAKGGRRTRRRWMACSMPNARKSAVDYRVNSFYSDRTFRDIRRQNDFATVRAGDCPVLLLGPKIAVERNHQQVRTFQGPRRPPNFRRSRKEHQHIAIRESPSDGRLPPLDPRARQPNEACTRFLNQTASPGPQNGTILFSRASARSLSRCHS